MGEEGVQEDEAIHRTRRRAKVQQHGYGARFVQRRLRIILCQFGRCWVTGRVQTITSVLRTGEVAKCLWGPDSRLRSLPGK